MIHRVRMRTWVLLTSLLCFDMGHKSVVSAMPAMGGDHCAQSEARGFPE